MKDTSTKTDTNCDTCGNKNVKIHRRYKGEAYCSNCYITWFIKKPCSKCGEIDRLHKKENFAVCTNCRMSEPCIRCGGDAFKDGANTEYGRVCQICYQGHFKIKKKCFECGQLKRNISRYSKISHDQPICTSCYGRHVMDICGLCHKHRELIDTEQGRICKKCDEFGEVPCESCDKPIWAGMGKQCQDCYWLKRVLHEADLNAYLLKHNETKKAYSDFVKWLADCKGSMVAALKHNKFIYFFIRCDEIWHKIPSYESLVQEFKPNGLREHLTVLRWLITTEQIAIDATTKAQVAEQERIINLLAKFDDKTPCCINRYHESLEQKLLEGRTSLKSVRLALQPAIDICIESKVKGSNTPTQEQLDSYLMVKHGQYSAIYGFVTFLNKNYDLDLACNKPSKDDIQKLKRKELEKEIMLLHSKPKPLSPKDRLKWLQLSMAYFHQVDVKLKMLKTITVHPCNEEMSKIIMNNKEYWLPKIE